MPLQPLASVQDQRRVVDPTTAAAVEAFLEKLDACIAAERDFHLIIDDPAG